MKMNTYKVWFHGGEFVVVTAWAAHEGFVRACVVRYDKGLHADFWKMERQHPSGEFLPVDVQYTFAAQFTAAA